MNLYCTLAQAKSRIKTTREANNRTDYDDQLVEYLYTVSRELDNAFYADRPLFTPIIETRRFPVDSTNVDSLNRLFRFQGSLLELTSVSASGTALTLTTHVSAYPDSTRPPFHQLLLRDAASISSWYANCSSTNYDVPAYVDITGVWGIHRQYSRAWKATTTLAAAMSDTTTLTLTLTSVVGDNYMGVAPKISVGSLLKIDTELLNVTAVNETTGVVTVEERGGNGSTAATHLIAAAVYVWEVEVPVRMAVARQVGLMLSREGSYTTTEFTDAGVQQFPTGWLNEVKRAMNRYVYDY